MKKETRNTAKRRWSRRNWLKAMGLATVGAGWPATATPAAGLIRRVIPSSGEQIPAIGLGTARSFDTDPDGSGMAALGDVLGQFFQRGGTLVDTSPMYGRAESVLGRLFDGLPAQTRRFVATKVWTRGEAAGIEQMQTSAQLLRTPVIDLMQIHNLLDWRTHLATLRDWKARGRIRYLGITHYHAGALDRLESLLNREPLDFVQINYSLAEPEAERRLLPLARDRGVAVIVNRPFARGAMFRRVRGRELPPWAADIDCSSWAQLFLKYILADAGVTCPIPATSNPRHLLDNMGAAYGRLPDPAQRRRIWRLWQNL